MRSLAAEVVAVARTFGRDDLRQFGGEERMMEMADDLRAGKAVR